MRSVDLESCVILRIYVTLVMLELGSTVITQVHTMCDTDPLINSRYRVGRILNVILISYFSYIKYASPKHFFLPKLFFDFLGWQPGSGSQF